MRSLLVLLIVQTAPLSAQRADTAATRTALLAADRALAAEVAARGPAAILDLLAPSAPFNFPDEPVYRGPTEARTAFLARYAARGTRIEWTPQHAVVSSDGKLGCTVGITQMTVAADTTGHPRYGRYITCWDQNANGAWRIAGHARNGEATFVPLPAPGLKGAPHSATAPHLADELRSALDADVAFAKLSVDSGPATAFVRYAAPDAMLLGARETPVRGPVEIRPGFTDFPSKGRFAWTPIRTLGAAGGGLAFTVGESHLIQDDKHTYGKYITVWRREADGSWKYIFDLGSARPPDAPASRPH
jgi:ketosteroid isomerase-like protein